MDNWSTRRKTFGARREPTTNSIHIWHKAAMEPSHTGGRKALYPLLKDLVHKSSVITVGFCLTFAFLFFLKAMERPTW